MHRLKSAAAEPAPNASSRSGSEDGVGTPADGRDQREELADFFEEFDTFEMYRVVCPDCGRPLALLAGEATLPEHALCPTPWNPFVLTVCPGAGRPAADAKPADASRDAQEQDTDLLLTLPAGLDWRTQPFSHVGGPGSRPMRTTVAARH